MSTSERRDVDVDVRRGLDGVDGEQDALVGLDLGRDLGERLDAADLVVREHDRDEDRLVGDRGVELVRVDAAVAVDRHLDDLEAEPLEVLERVADGVVLDRRGHDPVAAGLARPRGALDREVVRLGAARREDDLARLRVQALRDALVGLVEPGPGLAPERVRGRRVAELLGQEREHRLERLGAEGRRGGVVEVDGHRPGLYAGRPVSPGLRAVRNVLRAALEADGMPGSADC